MVPSAVPLGPTHVAIISHEPYCRSVTTVAASLTLTAALSTRMAGQGIHPYAIRHTSAHPDANSILIQVASGLKVRKGSWYLGAPEVQGAGPAGLANGCDTSVLGTC